MLAYRSAGPVARTDVFEGMFRSGDVDIDVFLVLGAQKNLGTCCTSIGWDDFQVPIS